MAIPLRLFTISTKQTIGTHERTTSRDVTEGSFRRSKHWRVLSSQGIGEPSTSFWDMAGGTPLAEPRPDGARATNTPRRQHTWRTCSYDNSSVTYVVSTSPLLGTRLIKPPEESSSDGRVQEKQCRVGDGYESVISDPRTLAEHTRGHRSWSTGPRALRLERAEC